MKIKLWIVFSDTLATFTHMILNILVTNHFYMYDKENNPFLIK